jgi:hypothetical protein
LAGGTAGNARASRFGRLANFISREVDLSVPDASLWRLPPWNAKVVVQAASLQTGNGISAQDNSPGPSSSPEGGLSADQPCLQARISLWSRVAVKAVRPQAYFINCCFPDVVNPLIAALDLPITSGVGNIAILANAFAGALGDAGRLKVLAHYQNLSPWRQPPDTRAGRSARAWIDGEEVADVYARFASVRLTREPAIEISGPSGVPLMVAMAAGKDWRGHMPGPNGLPGGYPVMFFGAASSTSICLRGFPGTKRSPGT